jgi:hypothetical protein
MGGMSHGMFGGFNDFGQGGGFTQQFSSFSSMGGPGSSSTKTQSFIENGKRVTRTEKTTVDQSGRKNTVVTEEIDEGNGRK